MNRAEQEKNYFELIHHEDDLINHRLTWLLASQSLLFAGYAVLVTKDREQNKSLVTPEQFQAALKWVPILGMSIALLILIGIIAAVIASIILVKRSGRKEAGVAWLTSVLGWVTALLFPIGFLVAWWNVKP
jgi:hypothetical protein